MEWNIPLKPRQNQLRAIHHLNNQIQLVPQVPTFILLHNNTLLTPRHNTCSIRLFFLSFFICLLSFLFLTCRMSSIPSQPMLNRFHIIIINTSMRIHSSDHASDPITHTGSNTQEWRSSLMSCWGASPPKAEDQNFWAREEMGMILSSLV